MAAPLRRTTNSLLSQSRLFASPPSSNATFPSFRAAKSAVISESDPEKLADLFFSHSSTFPCFSKHRPIYHLVVHKLCRANRCDLVDRIIRHHLSHGDSSKPISEGFLIRLVMLYSNAGMVDNALCLFDDVVPEKYTEKSLCAILTVLLRNKLFDKFHQVFGEMPRRMSISPGVKSYNLVLRAYCEEDKVEMASKLIEIMENEHGVVPDINCYNVLLGAYLKNKNWHEFDAVVKEVLRRGLEGNMTTYNHKIVRLCKDKECVRAKKLLDEMVAKGIKQNSASYNAIIDGFCRVGDLESAKMVLNKMVDDGFVSPCSFGYYKLLRHMVKEGEFDSAMEICKEIMERKWVPPFEAMEDLAKGLVSMSKTGEAKEMIEKMKKILRGEALDSWEKIEAALSL